jgi:hypothetical protein
MGGSPSRPVSVTTPPSGGLPVISEFSPPGEYTSSPILSRSRSVSVDDAIPRTSSFTTPSHPLPPPLPTPPSPPTPRSIPPTRDEIIRNFVAESRGCNQLEILLDSHGTPTQIVELDHDDSEAIVELESTMEEINTESKRAFNTFIHGTKLKFFIQEVLIWDNRVAFSVRDPDTDDNVIFRIYHRR